MTNSRYTPEQQAANRKKWIEALESGKYKQTKSCLRDFKDGYCCLGVACDINPDIERRKIEGSTYYYYNGDNYDNECTSKNNWQHNMLPIQAADALGISIDGRFNNPEMLDTQYLWQLNDVLGWDFKKIAQFIRDNEASLVENRTIK